ncbi:MAG TPA: DUF503 domain-containing protein [Acidimicrobiales bacterium]|nr:DUF503 domain-containing protein [Acidimicrobiales bacterium]
MHVATLTVELHLPDSHSLKEKRAVLRPIIDGCRHRFAVAAAEVDHQDRWQRATIGVATVSSSVTHAGEVLDAVERFVWSFPEAEVTACRRDWVEQVEA